MIVTVTPISRGRGRRRSGGRSASASNPTWPKRWSAPPPAKPSKNRGCCSPSVYNESRRALAEGTLSFADFLRRENLVLRSDLLRPWANWVTPEAERTRRYDTYFFVGALPQGQRADGANTESDRAGWTTPEAAIDDFAAGRNFLLPPTWTELDSLAGRTVGDVLAVERQIVRVQPHLEIDGDNWVLEFFDSNRYHQARKSGGSMGWLPKNGVQ
jgi:hypothetical protein